MMDHEDRRHQHMYEKKRDREDQTETGTIKRRSGRSSIMGNFRFAIAVTAVAAAESSNPHSLLIREILSDSKSMIFDWRALGKGVGRNNFIPWRKTVLATLRPAPHQGFPHARSGLGRARPGEGSGAELHPVEKNSARAGLMCVELLNDPGRTRRNGDNKVGRRS